MFYVVSAAERGDATERPCEAGKAGEGGEAGWEDSGRITCVHTAKRVYMRGTHERERVKDIAGQLCAHKHARTPK